MPFTNNYDVTFPPDTQQANQLGADLRNLALNVQQRMAAISGLDAAKPSFGTDIQPANWNGVLFFAIDTKKVYQFVNPNWVNVTSSIGAGITDYDNSVPVTVNSAGVSAIVMQSVVIPSGALQAGSFVEVVALVTGTNNAYSTVYFGAQPLAVSPVGAAQLHKSYIEIVSSTVFDAASEVTSGTSPNVASVVNATIALPTAITVSTYYQAGGINPLTSQFLHVRVRL